MDYDYESWQRGDVLTYAGSIAMVWIIAGALWKEWRYQRSQR